MLGSHSFETKFLNDKSAFLSYRPLNFSWKMATPRYYGWFAGRTSKTKANRLKYSIIFYSVSTIHKCDGRTHNTSGSQAARGLETHVLNYAAPLNVVSFRNPYNFARGDIPESFAFVPSRVVWRASNMALSLLSEYGRCGETVISFLARNSHTHKTEGQIRFHGG